MVYQQGVEYVSKADDSGYIDAPALLAYSGGRNFNTADGSRQPTADTTYYGSPNNNTFHSTTTSSAHNFMTYNSHGYCLYPSSGSVGMMGRVSSPEQMGHAYPAPTSARSKHRQRHDEAHRTKHEKRATKRKKDSTDTIMSTTVHQGSDEQKIKYEGEGNDDPLLDTGEGPWTGVLAEDWKRRNGRLEKDMNNPNLPR
ncbi:uncharacterized protein PG998_011169 [Apiospora kogelbergensis]|uniref:uncharacterized protein n=1 Tax=Apiospora kogelbergensis TaxID=1337665 RepID=UPI00312F535C